MSSSYSIVFCLSLYHELKHENGLKSNEFQKFCWKVYVKELSFCHNLKFSNFYISATSGYKPLIFQSYRINSWKYLRSTTLGGQDIEIRIFEFVAKTQFLSLRQRMDTRRGEMLCLSVNIVVKTI